MGDRRNLLQFPNLAAQRFQIFEPRQILAYFISQFRLTKD